MEREAILKKLNTIFCDVFEDDSIVLNYTITNTDILNWDSLTNMMLISEIEKSFGVKFTINDMMKMSNVGEIVNLILEKLS